jgi:hypothetical protein
MHKFIRIFRPGGEIELLVNVDHISTIEVGYQLERKPGEYWQTSLEEGAKNSDATRFYKIRVPGEEILLKSNPGSPVMNVIEEIYKSAIKA